jgi:hypothetical protein
VYLGTDPALGIPKAVAGVDPLAAGVEAATDPPGVNPPIGLDTGLGAGGVYLGTDPAPGIPNAVAGADDEEAGAGLEAAGAGYAGTVEAPGVYPPMPVPAGVFGGGGVYFCTVFPPPMPLR